MHFLASDIGKESNWLYEDPLQRCLEDICFGLALNLRPQRAGDDHNDKGEHTEHGKGEQERTRALRRRK